jgi:hypothetical protein
MGVTYITAKISIGAPVAEGSIPPEPKGGVERMHRRRRFRHAKSLEERLAQEALELREEAGNLLAGSKREALLRKARQDETAAYLAEWLTSPGLQSPK